MNTLIVKNYLGRWGIVIALCSVLQIIFTFIGSNSGSILPFSPLVLFMGPVALSFDLSKGIARTILLLPVQRSEVTKTLWWIGVGLPTIWITILTLAGMTGSVVSGNSFDGPELFQNAVTSFLTLSVVYFALTGLPTNIKEAQEWTFRSIFFGALWGFSIGGSMFIGRLIERGSYHDFTSYMVFLIIGIGFSFWGYQRTDAMLSARSTGRSESRSITAPPRKSIFEFDSEASGFNHFIITIVTQVFVFSIVFIIATSLFQTLFIGMLAGKSSSNTSWVDNSVRSLQGQSIIFVLMPSFFLATKLMGARVFRALPLTASQLSNQFFKLITISIAAQITLLFTILALIADLAAARKLAIEFFMLGGIGTLIIPLILRFGLKSKTLTIAMPIIFLGTLGRIFLPEMYTLYTSLIIGIGSIATSRALTERLLSSSSHPYRNLNQQKFAAAFYGKG